MKLSPTHSHREIRSTGLRRRFFRERLKLLARAGCPALFGVLLLRAAPSGAETKLESTCGLAYEQAQVARADGDLLRASVNLVSCAGVSCPDAMQADCTRWLEEVRASLPTVVFRAVNPMGNDVRGAVVSIDGGAEQALDGRAVQLNPGAHDVAIRASGYNTRLQHLQLIEGHKLRTELVTLSPIDAPRLPANGSAHLKPSADAADEPAAIRSPGRRITAVQWGAGSLGLIGAAGFAYFGLKARSGERDLDRCAPNCSRGDVSDVKRDYAFSNVSLGVGVAAVSVGVAQYLLQDSGGPRSSASTSNWTRLRFSASARLLQLEGSF